MRWQPISIIIEVVMFYTFDAREIPAIMKTEKIEKAASEKFVGASKEGSDGDVVNMDFIFNFLSNNFDDEYQGGRKVETIENSKKMVSTQDYGSEAVLKYKEESESQFENNLVNIVLNGKASGENEDQTSASKTAHQELPVLTPRQFGLHGRQNKVFWSDQELLLVKAEKDMLDNPEAAASNNEEPINEVDGITEDIFKVEHFKEAPVKGIDEAMITEKTGMDMVDTRLDYREDRSSLATNTTSRPKLRVEVEEAPAQARQFPAMILSSLSVSSIEDTFQESLQNLPRDIDDAREVIVEDIATRNMLGYTIAVGFFSGAALDTLGDFFVEERFLSELVTDRGLWYKLGWLWFYAAGFAGPWLFPSTFNGGDPDLRCSSVDFFLMLAESNLGNNIRSITSRPQGELRILTENMRVEFNSRLECVVGNKNKYKEAEAVHATFARLLRLINLHHDLTGPPRETFDIQAVDDELLRIWDSIPVITQEVHDAVTSRRANTAGIYVFIGLLNLLGAVFGLLFDSQYDRGSYSNFPGGPEFPSAVRQTVDSFTLNSQFNNSLVLGETLNAVSEAVAWGYSYYMPYFLFIEEAEPGCGSEDLDDVYSRYQQLRSFQVLMSSGVARPAVVKYFVSEWRRELGVALNCLLTQKEGLRLRDTMDMFVTLANYRLSD